MIATKGKTPAVAYYRMSSDKQEASIPAQRVAVEKYAEQNGYCIVGEYLDEGISGDATEKRLQFQKMIADCASDKFQAVLCWDQDRFGRFDPLEAGYWIKPMRDAGVRLVTVAQGVIDWDDFAGRIVFSVTQEAKHAYLRDLSRNVLRGQIEAAKRGEWLGGNPPLGFSVENKRLTTGSAREVRLVRRLYRDYLKGMSLRGLMEWMNETGIKSPRGKLWTPASVRVVLKNEAYTGKYIWPKKSRAKYNRISNGQASPSNGKRIDHDPDDQIVIEDNHPAIIDRETFDTVQKRLQERKDRSTPRRNGGEYIFTGLVYCEHCGSKMHGTHRQGNEYLVCSGNLKHGKTRCKRYSIRQDLLLELVLKKIETYFTSAKSIDTLRRSLSKKLKSHAHPENVEALRKQLKSVDRKLSRAKSRLLQVDDDMVDILQEQIRDMRNEHAAIAAALEAAETPRKDIEADHDREIARAIEGVQGLRETFLRKSPHVVREFLNQSIDRIDLSFTTEMHGSKPLYLPCSGHISLRPAEVWNVLSTAGRTSLGGITGATTSD